MGFFTTIVHRKTLIGMLFLGLSLLGIFSYRRLPLEMMPEIEYPYLIVQITSSIDMDPGYFEKQAVIPVEGVIGTLEGVSEIESRIRQGRGTVYAYFNPGVNLNYTYLKLQEKINKTISELPEIFNVRLVQVDTDRLSNMFMRLQVRGTGGLERLRSVIENTMRDEFESIDGVSNVEVTGGELKAVEIVLDPESAKAYRLTPARVRALIRNNNRQKRFVGHAYEENKHYFVNIVSEYDDIADLEYIVVDRRGPVYLRDIAEITFGAKEQTSISRVNGKEAIILLLMRDANTNLIELSRETRDVIHRLNNELKPQDIEIIIQTDEAEEMETNINLIMELALVGGLLAVVILWFFIRNIRLVITIVLSIPVSILIAFNLFYAFNITLNSLTLVGMVLAIGMLLDSSIVVLENIYRWLSLKRGLLPSVTGGTKEVWRSITAATFTTALVFLPFIFSTDITIKTLGRHIGFSIISTLFVSLVVAFLLLPMITYTLLERSKKKLVTFNKVSFNNRLMQIYRLFLKSALRFPARTIIVVLFVFIMSIVICLSLSLDVPTEIELNQFNLYVTMPKGATLDKTSGVVSQLENNINDIEEIQDIISSIYEEEATVTVSLKEDFKKINNRTIYQIKDIVEERVEDFRAADVSLSEPAGDSRFSGGMTRNPMASFERMFGIGAQQEKVLIKGNDFEILRKIADNIEYYLNELETIASVRVNVGSDQPEIHLLFDSRLMAINDISLSSVSDELASFENEVTSGVTFKQGLEDYDIIIRNKEVEEEKDFEDLENLQVLNNSDNPFMLDSFSRLVYSYGISGINRLNQRKQIEIIYRFEDEINDSKSLLEAARSEVSALVASLNVPSGVVAEVVYDVNEFTEFYFLIGAAFILIYMILASVFESMLMPIVMMFTIPLATIGSFWALILTGNSLFNVNSLTGFLILFGVVVNNGIIFLDYTNILRRRGWNRTRALIAAGQARVRPILITAITTIVAMFPLAMGKQEYVSQIGASFAITVIGGLTFSTLFTLVFIPTVYSAVETALKWLRELSLRVKVIQIILLVFLSVVIYTTVDSFLWQLSYFIISVISIPGLVWFITTSLKKAQEDFLKGEKSLNINIRSLVKIYDTDTRFIREWKKGEKIQERLGLSKTYTSLNDFSQLTWQLPLLGFMIYFVYFYLSSHLWIYLLSFTVYFFILYMIKPVSEFLIYYSATKRRNIFAAFGKHMSEILMWVLPVMNVLIFYYKFFRTEILVFIFLSWYLGLIIYTTSNKLHREKINIMRLKGKFAEVRKHFYRFIQVIPVIGSKKNPFRALDGITLTIKSGMFGLLGPNGAGKTTIMRIICGIYNQSRGTMRMNDINFRDKREELLGLIGYLPQEFGFYENMTAYEFLDYMALLKRIYDTDKREEIVNYSLISVHLTEHRDRKIGTFSGGMKQRLGIAMILLNLPRILVVDEPTAGLDPRERIRFRNLMVDLSKDRVVIFSTHIIEDISSSCNKVAVLNKGQLYYSGEPQAMVHAAEGKVWMVSLEEHEFNALQKELWIVHHMQVGDKIRIRCLSGEKPHPEAEPAKPSLEDSYLWLLGKKNREKIGRVEAGTG